MLCIDDTRPPTAFQRHVLQLLRCVGPCSAAQLCSLCDQPATAVRLAVWLLTRGGFAQRAGRGLYDVSSAGRLYLATLQVFQHRDTEGTEINAGVSPVAPAAMPDQTSR